MWFLAVLKTSEPWRFSFENYDSLSFRMYGWVIFMLQWKYCWSLKRSTLVIATDGAFALWASFVDTFLFAFSQNCLVSLSIRFCAGSRYCDLEHLHVFFPCRAQPQANTRARLCFATPLKRSVLTLARTIAWSLDLWSGQIPRWQATSLSVW